MNINISHEFDVWIVAWLDGDEIKLAVFDEEYEAEDEKDRLEDRELGPPNGLSVKRVTSWGPV